MSRAVAYTVSVLMVLFVAHGGAVAKKKRAPIAEESFRLSKKGSAEVVFSPDQDGILIVRALVRKPAANTPVRLVLEGPGGLVKEKQGPAPLKLELRIGESGVDGRWRVTVHNVSRLGEVTGKLKILLDPAADWQ